MPSPGVIVDRGIRILRLSLWTGAAFDFVAAAWLGMALTLSGHPLSEASYLAVLALTLATLGGVRLVVAYAPYGNRRLVRILIAVGAGMAFTCWWFGSGTGLLGVAASIHAVLTAGLLLGLRLARL